MIEDILLSHAGKQHSYKLAISIQKLGRLKTFITSSYYDPSRFPDKLFAKFLSFNRFLAKRYEPYLSRRVKRFFVFEIPELILRGLFGNSSFISNVVCLRDELFDMFVAKTQVKNCKIFWGFQGSCLESLKVAKKNGMTTFLELATGHVKTAITILEEEKKKNPEWADSISNLYFPNWYLRRLEQEPFVSDYCIVASEFTKKTLEGVGIESRKIIKLPLGVDLERFRFKERVIKDPFQIIFVGGVGQRKGIKYLLEAVKLLNSDKIRLKIIGPIVGKGKAIKKYSKFYDYLGVLGNAEIVKHMHDSDCLVLPSLFEGFGLVIPEAMATGMPVVASPNSAAPEIIREGVDGFVVEPADICGLAGRIHWMACNRKKIIEMGISAAERAREFSWDKHTERLADILNNKGL